MFTNLLWEQWDLNLKQEQNSFYNGVCVARLTHTSPVMRMPLIITCDFPGQSQENKTAENHSGGGGAGRGNDDGWDKYLQWRLCYCAILWAVAGKLRAETGKGVSLEYRHGNDSLQLCLCVMMGCRAPSPSQLHLVFVKHSEEGKHLDLWIA